MSAALWVSSTWVVGECVGGVSCGNGVNVLDGGGLLSDLACCLFLSYLVGVRNGESLSLSEGVRTRALARAAFAFLSSASDISRERRWSRTEVNSVSRQRQSAVVMDSSWNTLFRREARAEQALMIFQERAVGMTSMVRTYSLEKRGDRDMKEGRICAWLKNVYHKNHRRKIFN